LVVTDMRDPLKPDPFEAIKKSQNWSNNAATLKGYIYKGTLQINMALSL
jgi:hypothetical protein